MDKMANGSYQTKHIFCCIQFLRGMWTHIKGMDWNRATECQSKIIIHEYVNREMKNKNYPLFPRWTRKTKLVYSICYVAVIVPMSGPLTFLSEMIFFSAPFFSGGKFKSPKDDWFEFSFWRKHMHTYTCMQWSPLKWRWSMTSLRFLSSPLTLFDGKEQWGQKKPESIVNETMRNHISINFLHRIFK